MVRDREAMRLRLVAMDRHPSIWAAWHVTIGAAEAEDSNRDDHPQSIIVPLFTIGTWTHPAKLMSSYSKPKLVVVVGRDIYS